MNRASAFVITVALLLAAAAFFFPKERVVGGLRGGPIGPGETAYREDYTCVGVPYDFCPNWPDYGCDYLCFGIVTSRTCSMETYQETQGITRIPIACEGPPGWKWRSPGWELR